MEKMFPLVLLLPFSVAPDKAWFLVGVFLMRELEFNLELRDALSFIPEGKTKNGSLPGENVKYLANSDSDKKVVSTFILRR